MTLLPANLTFIAGYSIPSVLFTVSQPHFPLTITPPLPDGVNIIQQGEFYAFTGVFEKEGDHTFVVVARNEKGSDSMKVKIIIACTY